MKQVNWESVIGQLDDELLQEALSGCCRRESLPDASKKEIKLMKKQHTVFRRFSAIAAALALVCSLGITAYATNLFGILDMDVVLDADPEAQVISITGYRESPQYKASLEWQNYLDQAMKDGTNEMSPAQEEDIYRHYNAFSQEAKDTLDSLLEKYGLRKYETKAYVEGQQELYTAVGISDFLPASAGLEELSPCGTVYDGTSIASYCDSADLSNGKNVPYDIFCIRQGVFLYTGFLVGDVSEFEEWTYTTKEGITLTLCLAENKSIVMAQLNNSFLFFNIRTGASNADPNRSSYGRDPLTRSDLEEFVELFRFAALNEIG